VGAKRGLGLPLTRLGLLLVVGSLAASGFRYYIAFAQEVSDLSAKEPALDRKSVWNHFAHDFLFSGGAPGVLFWVGIAVLGLGIARNLGAFRRT
jgi:hypothetical protein